MCIAYKNPDVDDGGEIQEIFSSIDIATFKFITNKKFLFSII